jgi:hypothetical protein
VFAEHGDFVATRASDTVDADHADLAAATAVTVDKADEYPWREFLVELDDANECAVAGLLDLRLDGTECVASEYRQVGWESRRPY